MKPYDLAFKFLGVAEDKRTGYHNPQIVAWLDYAGCDWADDDETPWCSAFMYCMCDWVGFPVPAQDVLVARSWMTLQSFTPLKNLEDAGKQYEINQGDILIFARQGSPMAYKVKNPEGKPYPGHVGFYADSQPLNFSTTVISEKTLPVLGGNQGDRVSIRPYLVENLLGFVPV